MIEFKGYGMEADGRYARVLYLSSLVGGKANSMGRLLALLRSRGHVVQLFCSVDDSDASFQVQRMAEVFGPDLVLWDVSSVDGSILPQVGCPVIGVALGDTDGAWTLGAFLDEDYRAMRLADPAAAQNCVCVMQPQSAGRARQVDDLLREVKLGGLVALAGGWQDNLGCAHTGSSLSYWCRRAKYSVVFRPEVGEALPVAANMALRIQEGSLLLVEEGVRLPQWLEAVAIPFASGELIDVVRSLEQDPLRYTAAHEAQQGALDDLPRADQMLESLFSYADSITGCPVRSLGRPAIKVVLYGWFGAQNFGDDLLLELVHARVRERYPSAEVLVIGANPHQIRVQHGLGATEPHQKHRICEWLDGAAALIYCGGLMFDDPLGQTAGEAELAFDPWIDPAGQAAICSLARMYDVPTYFLGIGGGPMDTPAMQRYAKFMSAVGAHFLTRDQNTSELLLAAGADPNQVGSYADLSFGAKRYVDRHVAFLGSEEAWRWLQVQGRPYLVVSLRSCHRNPPDLASCVAQALDGVCERRDMSVLYLPLDTDDVGIQRQAFDLMEHKERAYLIGQRPTVETILGYISSSSATLSMRLHCSLLHMVLGRPAVGLNYNDKIEAQFTAIGQEGCLLSLDASAKDMSALLIDALDASESFADEVADVMAQQQALVDAEFCELFAAIDKVVTKRSNSAITRPKTYCYPRSVSLTEQELGCARSEVQRLQAQVASLERERDAAVCEVAAVRGSTSYRLGNIMVRPISALKRRLLRKG